MANSCVGTSGQNTTTSGKFVFTYIQKDCGQGWKPVGCINITDLVLDPTSTTYNLCIGPDGRVKRTKVRREDDPRPFTVVYNLTDSTNRGKVLGLHNRQRNGCRHNMLVKISDCPLTDAEALNPANYSDAIMLYGLEESGGLQFGNNTLRSRDDRQADDLLAQTQYTFDCWQYLNQYTFSSLALTAGGGDAIDTFDVYNTGKCADGTCVTCETPACQLVLFSDSNDIVVSTNKLVSTTTTTVGVGVQTQIIDGKLFRYTITNLEVSNDNGLTWVTAVANIAFAGLSRLVKVDPNLYVALGSGGNVWQSVNGGYNWTRVATGGTTAWTWGVWDGSRLWAVGTNGVNFVVAYSLDFGVTFTTIGTAVSGVNPPRAYNAGGRVFVHANSRLYGNVCQSDGTQAISEIVGPYSGTLTGVGGCETNCNEIWLTTNTGQIYRSIDGGANWNRVNTPGITITSPANPFNPISCCEDSIYFAFGKQVISGVPTGSNGANIDPFA
jgi:hypothetical protein